LRHPSCYSQEFSSIWKAYHGWCYYSLLNEEVIRGKKGLNNQFEGIDFENRERRKNLENVGHEKS